MKNQINDITDKIALFQMRYLRKKLLLMVVYTSKIKIELLIELKVYVMDVKDNAINSMKQSIKSIKLELLVKIITFVKMWVKKS